MMCLLFTLLLFLDFVTCLVCFSPSPPSSLSTPLGGRDGGIRQYKRMIGKGVKMKEDSVTGETETKEMGYVVAEEKKELLVR